MLQMELNDFQVSPHKSSDKLHGKLGKPLNLLFATQNTLATKIHQRNLNSDHFSEKSSCVSDLLQVTKQHKTFHIEAIIPMPPVLDAPTFPSCFPLHLNSSEAVHILSSDDHILFLGLQTAF